jgi:hypothetical protein
MNQRIFLTLIVLSCLLTPCVAQTSEPERPARQDDYKRMPWHLVDLWWDLGSETPFESYSIDCEISHDLPATTNLYIAPIGLGQLGGSNFYGGIQTNCDGYTKLDRRLRKLGPGLLMSMWGQRDFEAIRPSLGGFCQSSGHEGDFVSVRRPYDWSAGKYTYRIVRMDEETIGEEPFTWVGAFLHVHETEEHIYIGALRFKGHELKLGRKIASFVEVYGRRIPVEEIPQVTVTFSNLRINGQAAQPKQVEVIYPREVPDYAQATRAEGEPAVVIEVGQEVKDRQERQVKWEFK